MPLFVKDVMNDSVVTIGPEVSVNKAIERLLDSNVSSLLVVDQNRRMIGYVDEAALLAATVDGQVRNDPVALHMDRNFVHVRPSDPLESAIDISILHRIRQLPVLENGRLVGLISRRDVLRAVFGQREALVY